MMVRDVILAHRGSHRRGRETRGRHEHHAAAPAAHRKLEPIRLGRSIERNDSFHNDIGDWQ